MHSMIFIINLFLKISIINKEKYISDIIEIIIMEDKMELKLDFDVVKNEVKQAAQEAIPKSTIKQYQRYKNIL